MIKKMVAMAIIKNNKGEFLLQKKTTDYPVFSGKWCLFGGSIEKNENALDALKRELFEEMEIKFEQFRFLGKCSWKHNGYEVEEQVYELVFNKKISEIKLAEGAGFAFFNKKELESLDIFEKNFETIKKYI